MTKYLLIVDYQPGVDETGGMSEWKPDRGAPGDGSGRLRAVDVTPVPEAASIEDLLRESAPQVLGVLARRFGDFAAAEDAVQEAHGRGHRADPARGRRSDHRRDRERLPGAGGDARAADQPGEAADQGVRGAVPDARAGGAEAHFHEMAGDVESAVRCYRAAAARTTSVPEQRYLATRAARLQLR